MFALMPWRKERKVRRALLPRGERFRRMDEFDMMDEFDTLFERLLGWPLLERELPLRPWGVETEETDKEVVFHLELPGFELPELDVRVVGDELIVEARHVEPAEAQEGKENKEKEPKELRPEGRYGHVREVITLPPDIDVEKVEAKYHSGILEVRFPRLPEARGRRIEVKV
jgi:HSP20 family protein